MSFTNVPLQLLQKTPENSLSSLLSGFTGGIGTVQQLQQQNLLNKLKQAEVQQQQAQAAIAPQLSQANLQKQLLANKIQAAQAALAPQAAQAALLQAQVKPDLMKAQTKQALAKSLALPYQAVGSYFGGLGKLGQTSLSANPSYIMARMINSPALLAMASKDKTFAKNLGSMMQRLGQQSAQQGIPDQTGTQQMSNILQTPVQTDGESDQQALYHQLMAPEHHAQNQIHQDNAPIVQHTQNADNWNDDDVSNFQQSLSDALLKKTTTANIMNQRQYAGVLDNLFNRAGTLIPSVSTYAGFRGKTKKGLDAFQQSVGNSSPDYQNYLYFTRTVAPLIANEMRRTLGGQASDREVAAMNNIVDPTYWDSNPETAQKQWQFLVDSYRNSVNPALMASPSQVVNRFGSSKPFVNRSAAQPQQVTQQQPQAQIQQQQQEAGETIRIRLPNGKIGSIPAKNLDRALKLGATRL